MKRVATYFLSLVLMLAGGLYLLLSITTNKFISRQTPLLNAKPFMAPVTTEVYVLGVIHKPTENITYESLYENLEKIKPVITLFEFDSSGFDKAMNLKSGGSYVMPAFMKRFTQNNLENIAVRKYLYHNKSAIVRPYEWALREAFHKKYDIINKPGEIFQLLDKLSNENKLTLREKKILDNYYSLSGQLSKYADSTLDKINTASTDRIAAERQDAQYHKIKFIIDNNNHLQQYKDFYKINEAYWDIRNKAMADNIQKYIRLYPHSRIVVLCGYYHRYYLRNELALQQQNLHFTLKEFNE